MKSKRIVILGPVTTKTYFGGVANFDEELQKAFQRIGQESIIFTLQKDAQSIENNIVSCHTIFSLLKSIKQYSPDIVIASLQYGAFFYLLPKKIRKIYVLHGFFDRVYYDLLKSVIAPIYQKIVTLKADEVIANSYFTKMINKDFFSIKSDRVIHLGVANDYLQRYQVDIKNNSIKKEKGSILFASRLVASKRPEKVLMAMKILQEQNVKCHLYMAGDGPERINLQQYAKKNNINVKFLGTLPHDNLYDYYKKAEVFVSLNDSEPMGITFFEAMLLQCRIVCPFTGGQVESLYDLSKNQRCFVDVDSPRDIASGIEYMLYNDQNEFLFLKFYEIFNYNQVAKEFMRSI